MATPQCNEEYDASAVEPTLAARLVSAKRAQSGRWTLIVQVEVQVVLPDGRTLTESREVHLGGILQQGRKPYEDWRHS